MKRSRKMPYVEPTRSRSRETEEPLVRSRQPLTRSRRKAANMNDIMGPVPRPPKSKPVERAIWNLRRKKGGFVKMTEAVKVLRDKGVSPVRISAVICCADFTHAERYHLLNTIPYYRKKMRREGIQTVKRYCRRRKRAMARPLTVAEYCL